MPARSPVYQAIFIDRQAAATTNLVALRIDDPAKLAVLRVLAVVKDVAAFRFERCDHCVEIFNAVIDHERGFAGSKLVA